MIYDDNTLFPFGKHKGKPMKDVPASYLKWLDGQPWPSSNEWSQLSLRRFIQSNLQRISELQTNKK